MTHTPHFIWQTGDCQQFRFSAERLVSSLSLARVNQGISLSKAQSIGLDSLPATENEVWVFEARATAEMEGEKLNLDVVRPSVARRWGVQDASPAQTQCNVEGLLERACCFWK